MQSPKGHLWELCGICQRRYHAENRERVEKSNSDLPLLSLEAEIRSLGCQARCCQSAERRGTGFVLEVVLTGSQDGDSKIVLHLPLDQRLQALAVASVNLPDV